MSSGEEVGMLEGEINEQREDPLSDRSRSVLVSAAGTIPESVQQDTEPDAHTDQAAEPFLPAPPSPIADSSTVKQQKKKQKNKRGPLSFFSCLFCAPTTDSVEIVESTEAPDAAGVGTTAGVQSQNTPDTQPATPESGKPGTPPPFPVPAGAPAQTAVSLLRHEASSQLSSKTSHSTFSGHDSSNENPTTPFAHFLDVSLSGPLRIFGEEEEGDESPHIAARDPDHPLLHLPTAAAAAGQQPRGLLAAAVTAQLAARGGRAGGSGGPVGRRPSVPPHEDNDIVMMRSVDTAVSVHDHLHSDREGATRDSNQRSTASSSTLFFPVPAASQHSALAAAPLEVSDRDRAARGSGGGMPLAPFHQANLSFGEMLVQLQAIIEQDIAAHTLPGGGASDALKLANSLHLSSQPGFLKEAGSGAGSLASQPGSPRPSRTFLVVADDDSIATHRRLQISRSGRVLRGPPSEDGTAAPTAAVRVSPRHVSALDSRRGGKKVWFRRQGAASAALASASPAAHDGSGPHSSTPHSGIHNGGIFRASRVHHSAKARRAHHDPASRRGSRTSEHEDHATEDVGESIALSHARPRGRKRRAATELLLSASIASLWKAPWQAPGSAPPAEFVVEDPFLHSMAGTATAVAHKAASFGRKTTTSSEAPLITPTSVSHGLQPQRSPVPQAHAAVLPGYASVPASSGVGVTNVKGKGVPKLYSPSTDRTARGVVQSAVAAVALSSLHATWGPKRAVPQSPSLHR